MEAFRLCQFWLSRLASSVMKIDNVLLSSHFSFFLLMPVVSKKVKKKSD
jgi:hypothetical protein